MLNTVGEEAFLILSSLRVICATSLSRGVLVLTGTSIWLALLRLDSDSLPRNVEDSILRGILDGPSSAVLLS